MRQSEVMSNWARAILICGIAVGSVWCLSARFCGAEDKKVPGLPSLADDGYQTACGPIACYVAARKMGLDCSLASMIDKCDWNVGKMTELKQLHDTLSMYDSRITCTALRQTPRDMTNCLKDGNHAVLLAIRKHSSEINHVVCAIGIEDGKIIAVDYPELIRRFSEDELTDVWDGQVLLVSRSVCGWCYENILWLALPLSCAIVVILAHLRERTRIAS